MRRHQKLMQEKRGFWGDTELEWVDSVEANDFRANVQLHVDFVLAVEVGSGQVGLDFMFGLN